mmetsp:Transcript_20190/g.56727  ORF Transcript_20190/g.56727 Transcript_20190/m.56727 type:complete len:268 (+) Transcript_20190:19-822(+)
MGGRGCHGGSRRGAAHQQYGSQVCPKSGPVRGCAAALAGGGGLRPAALLARGRRARPRADLDGVVGLDAVVLQPLREVRGARGVLAGALRELLADVVAHELEGLAQHAGELRGHLVHPVVQLPDLVVLVVDVIVLVTDELVELVGRDVQLLLLLRELRLQGVDLVDQLLLQGLVLARHVRGDREGRALLLLEVLLQLVDLGAELDLRMHRLVGLRRLHLQLPLERLDRQAQVHVFLLGVHLLPHFGGAALLLLPPLLAHGCPSTSTF